jgi:hypothetical protein
MSTEMVSTVSYGPYNNGENIEPHIYQIKINNINQSNDFCKKFFYKNIELPIYMVVLHKDCKKENTWFHSAINNECNDEKCFICTSKPCPRWLNITYPDLFNKKTTKIYNTNEWIPSLLFNNVQILHKIINPIELIFSKFLSSGYINYDVNKNKLFDCIKIEERMELIPEATHQSNWAIWIFINNTMYALTLLEVRERVNRDNGLILTKKVYNIIK